LRLRIALCVVVGLGICATARANGFAISIKPAIVAPSLIDLSPEYGMTFPLSVVTSAAHFGYRTGNFLVGIGLEYSGYSGEDRNIYRDTSGHEDSSSVSNALRYSLFLPEVAVRYYFGGGEEGGQPDGIISPYVGLSAFYSIGSTDNIYDGVRDTAAIRVLNDDLTGNVGGTAMVGAEYAFNQSFSIGGEFGLRLISTSIDDGPESYTVHNEVGAETYAALCLNYYFQ
jgi:hypothetical protein